MGDELFVFEDVIGDAPGIHGGVVEKLEPVVRALFEAELPGQTRISRIVTNFQAWWRPGSSYPVIVLAWDAGTV